MGPNLKEKTVNDDFVELELKLPAPLLQRIKALAEYAGVPPEHVAQIFIALHFPEGGILDEADRRAD